MSLPTEPPVHASELSRRLVEMMQDLHADFASECERAKVRHEQLMRKPPAKPPPAYSERSIAEFTMETRRKRGSNASLLQPEDAGSKTDDPQAVRSEPKSSVDRKPSITSDGSNIFRTESTLSFAYGEADGRKSRFAGSAVSTSTMDFLRKRIFDDVNTPSHQRACSRMITNAVMNDKFEFVVVFLISLNALLMCMEMQISGQTIGAALKYENYGAPTSEYRAVATSVFEGADWVFGLCFVAELLMKVFAFRCKYFTQFWHYIDILCTAAFTVEKVAIAGFPVNSSIVRLLRLGRVFRLLKLIGSFEHLDVLHTMTTAIRGMLSVLCWALVLLGLILLMCALSLTQTLHATYFTEMRIFSKQADEMETAIRLFEYFGTFGRSMFSMFELALGNFAPVGRLLAEDVSEWFFAISIFHKVIIGFAVVGVINAIVLQETLKVASTDDALRVRQMKRQKEGLQKKFESFFRAMDVDGTEELTLDTMMQMSSRPEIRLWLQAFGIHTEDLHTLFLYCDQDGNGMITLAEFIDTIWRLREPALAFHIFDLQYMLSRREGIRYEGAPNPEESNCDPHGKPLVHV